MKLRFMTAFLNLVQGSLEVSPRYPSPCAIQQRWLNEAPHFQRHLELTP